MVIASKSELSDRIIEFLDTYQEELDTIEAFKTKRHMDIKILVSLYDLMMDHKIVAFSDMAELLYEEYDIVSLEFSEPRPLSNPTMRKYRTLLKEIEDFHVTFNFNKDGYGGWYMIYAPRHIAELCKKRHISLKTFMIDLREDLTEFHIMAHEYYSRRINRLNQPFQLTQLKIGYEYLIKMKMGKAFKSEKYIRTEQDLVILEFGDSRKGIRKEVYEK